jgi:lipopolysaccharide/colanic/teichoic acid biosynthesis glycosyltransferase
VNPRPDYRGKRTADVVIASVGLVLTLPLQAVIAVVVRTTSRGPAIHRGPRIGRGGRPFDIFKFRSMRVGAYAAGPAVTTSADQRVTRVGTWLRRTKLDELPQLLNVLRGEMSIVGPRPEDPQFVARYTAEQREILDWRPGITSPASVMFRDEESLLATADDLHDAYAEVSARKIAIDLDYFRTASFSGDVRWMIRTAAVVAGRSPEPGR